VAEQITRLRVFMASPGDTGEEKQRLERVVEELNKGIADENGIVLDLMEWESRTRPGIGEDAQDVINRQIPAPDIVIAMFWRRLGTPTHRAPSGTAEELQRALDAWRASRSIDVMVYFSTAPYSPTRDDLAQLRHLSEFRDYLEQSGFLVHEYNSAGEFEAKARQHLSAVVREWRLAHETSPTTSAERTRVPDGGRSPDRWYEQLVTGSLAVEFNARRRGDVHTLASVVGSGLSDQGFAPAATRASAALTELLMNVARHTEDGRARVEIDVDKRFQRRVSIAVHDRGEGFNVQAAMTLHYEAIGRGQREHGLLLVSRLATNLVAEPGEPPWSNVVSLDVYDPRVRESPLFDDPSVIPIGVDYQSPEVYRLGDEVLVGDHFPQALEFAIERDCKPLLDLFFGELRRRDASHLGIELSVPIRETEDGEQAHERVTSDLVWFGETAKSSLVSEALESYFAEVFSSGHVIVLLRGPALVPGFPWQRWVDQYRVRMFTKDDDVREHLAEIRR
jgi:anti-sigma regulatory factor (Ser/Thr protein kinase)